MMRLPPFVLRRPRTVEEAAAWLAESPADTMLLGGGTDVVPNMKRRQQTPRTLVALRQIDALRRVQHTGAITIGAGMTLTELLRDDRLRAAAPGLWQAGAQVATPHLRNMATLGGNLCLDTRCTYYDQTYEWRKAIGFCMKKDGQICWVATSSPRCLAVSSTDTAPMLQALEAQVRLVSASGTRTVPLADLYRLDGMHYLTRRADEILTDVVVPDQTAMRSTYWKLRRRGSIDFPVASAAVAARLRADRRVEQIRIVLGAVASRPLQAATSESMLTGEVLTDEAIAAAAEAAYTIAKPMDNTDYELIWRKRMTRALVTYALREIRGDDVRELRRRIARMDMLLLAGPEGPALQA
jgi:4-hydroxybenzoyl-CoA reductase subunit beta